MLSMQMTLQCNLLLHASPCPGDEARAVHLCQAQPRAALRARHERAAGAPLYFHFCTDADLAARRAAEADAFYCFMDIISEFRDHFCQQLVRAACGCALLAQAKLQQVSCMPL